MALNNIIAPRQTVVNSQGQPLAGGSVFLYEPGTTTFITSYTDSDLTTPHTEPVRLSGSGRANIWVTRDCDMVITDRNGNTVITEDNANPDDLGGGNVGGLVPNGSFEEDDDANMVPDGWVLVSEAGATNEIDTAESTDGAQSFRFTSSGAGGGSLTTEDFFPVNDVDNLQVQCDLMSSLATVRNIIRVEWYDITQTPISNSDPYDSTANPLVWTTEQLSVAPPANARFAKLRLIGIDPSVALAGSTWFDRVSVFYPAVVSGVFDNITIQDNEIITTNLNGELALRPNGAGPVHIISSDTVDLVDTNNPLNIGLVYPPATNPHIAFGASGIQAKTDATTAAATLSLNILGGSVGLYEGAIRKVLTEGTGIALAGALGNDPGAGGVQDSRVRFVNTAAQLAGGVGFTDGDVNMILENIVDSGDIILRATDAAGTLRTIMQGDPDGTLTLYEDGTARYLLGANLANLRQEDNVDATLMRYVISFADTTVRAEFGKVDTTGDIYVINRFHSGHVQLWGEDTGGTSRALFDGDPDGNARLFHLGASVVRTLTAANGGLEVNNTLTGGGFERALTLSDIGLPAGSSATFTPTFTGFASPPTNLITYTIIGAMVYLSCNAGNAATSNAVTMSITGIPTAIRPNVTTASQCVVLTDNGTTVFGVANISNAGTITFGVGPTTAGFTASGNKGIPGNWSMSWPLDGG